MILTRRRKALTGSGSQEHPSLPSAELGQAIAADGLEDKRRSIRRNAETQKRWYWYKN